MSDVHFSRIKLGLALVVSAGLFWLCLWVAMGGGPKAALGGGFAALVIAFAMLYFARYLLDNRILSIGATELEFHGMASTRRLRLDQIALMRVETQTVNYVTTRYLVIEPHQGHGRTIKFAATLLEGRFGGCEGVADLITNGAPDPEPFPLPRRAPTPPSAARAGGFGRKGL
ncbi:MAG: hypothetical protein NBV68_15975 [Erythrobacter sp.]|uniref:hypothetical protein n=1 Tax=Erythrobacter sp. TaxID=1042 RepID=UPI0025EE77FF|nr:hypothetical protein [Erythrobacter sp.]MCM0000877.1 hypothetical protein [Erythrobacter sp.]